MTLIPQLALRPLRSFRVPRARAQAALVALALLAALGSGAAGAYAVPGPIISPETSAAVVPTLTPGAWTVIGYSAHDRPVEAIRLGSGPNHVLVVAGLHGNEYGCDVARKLVAYLLANPTAVPAGVQLDVVANANPDGRAMRRRGNAHGVDLNRNFPARNWRRIKKRGATAGSGPGSEPETQVLMTLLSAGGYSRVISLHSRGPLVDYDGPGSRVLARRLAKRARMPVVRLAGIGRYYGSMGNYVPQRFGIPIVTVELKNRALPVGLREGILSAMQ